MYFKVTYFLFQGHMQQGGRPSPFDRNMGTKMAAKCVEWLCTEVQRHKQEDGKTPLSLPPADPSEAHPILLWHGPGAIIEI